ncbi:MAG: hypothetical protein HZB39_13965, partial [Planctomycetes bacterium]|nr:hypothetical protein [Planctomycetota bacterium]
MSKTLIVAQREFVENLRTKTFWVGIFALPVIFALSIFVARFMEENKDVRTYAILDRSTDEWLSRAVDERAAVTDLVAIGQAQASGSAEAKAEARTRIGNWFASLPTDHPIHDLLQRLAPIVGELGAADLLDPELATDEMAAKLRSPEAMKVITGWVFEAAKDPKRAGLLRSLASGIALARYRRVPLDELGVASDAAPEAVEKALNDAINAGKLFAYFIVPAEPVQSGKGSYVSNNLTDNDLREWFGGHATEIVRKQRIAALEGVTEEQARSLLTTFDFAKQKVSATGQTETVGKSEVASGLAPMAFVYLLW